MDIPSPPTLTDQIERIGIMTIKELEDPISVVADEQGNVFYMPDEEGMNLIKLAGRTRNLRTGLLKLAESGNLKDRSATRPEPQIIKNQEAFVKALLGKRPKLAVELADASVKAKILADVLKGSTEEAQAKQWIDVVDRVAEALVEDPKEYQVLKEERQRTAENPRDTIGRNRVDSYRSRLEKLLGKNNPKARAKIAHRLEAENSAKLAEAVIDTYLEAAWVNNAVRVLNRIQEPLGIKGKVNKLIDVLKKIDDDPEYTKIITKHGLEEKHSRHILNLSVIIEHSDKEEQEKELIEYENKTYELSLRKILETEKTPEDDVIYLVETKADMDRIKLEADRIKRLPIDEKLKEAKLMSLDHQFKKLIYPIANKVNRIFPHESATVLSKVLNNEEAICTGKTNALMAVSVFLGITARTLNVKQHTDYDTSGHVCFECDLPSGSKLVVDANSRNRERIKLDTSISIREQIAQNKLAGSLLHLKTGKQKLSRVIGSTNHLFINPQSNVLTYVIRPLGKKATSETEESETKEKPFLTIRVNPYTGEKEVWQADIPHPHLITLPDIDGLTFDTSAYTHNASIENTNPKVIRYLLLKQIRNSPYSENDYMQYIKRPNLSYEDIIPFIESVKQTRPQIYWQSIASQHCRLEARNGNLETAFDILDQMAIKSPTSYKETLHSTLNTIEFFLTRIEERERKTYEDRIVKLITNFRTDYPSIYYSDNRYFNQLAVLLREDKPTAEFLYYDLYCNGPDIFWSRASYVVTLSDLLTHNGKATEAIKILNNARAVSPEIFWNDEHSPLYKILCKIYETTDQKDEAIKLYNEASVYSSSFWESSYKGGYHNLAEIYSNIDRQKAIDICIQAKEKDPNFFDAKYKNGAELLLRLYELDKRYQDIIKISEEAIQKGTAFWSADNLFAIRSLGNAYANVGRYNEAISVYEKIKLIDVRYLDSDCIEIYKLYEKAGRIEESKIALDETITEVEMLKEKDKDLYAKLATKLSDLYVAENNTSKAFESLLYASENYKYFLYYSYAKELVDLAIKTGLPDNVKKIIDIYTGKGIRLRNLIGEEKAKAIGLE